MKKAIFSSTMTMLVVGALAYGQPSRSDGTPAPRLQDDDRSSPAARAPMVDGGIPYMADQPPAPITISTLPYGPRTQSTASDASMSGHRASLPIRRVSDDEVIPSKPQPIPQGSGEGTAGGIMGGCMGCLGGHDHEHEHVIQGDECCEGGCGCGQFAWVDGQWLHWRVKGSQQPPLLNLIAQSPCSCGNVDAVTIDGGGTRNMGWFDGARFTAGMWLCDCWGAEVSYMVLASKTIQNSFSSDGGFLLGIPFIDNKGQENNAIIMCPQQEGSFRSESTTRLWGVEANVFHSGCDCKCWGCNWLLGFRYLQLDESLDILNKTHVWNVGCGMPVGTDIALADDFATRNHFFGPQIGTRCDWNICRCISLNAGAKVAIGAVDEYIRIQGTNTCTCTGNNTVTPGGFFAQPTNIGSYHHTDFCVVPECRAGLDWAITCRIHANIGYSFLYMSEVVRPGDQIDRHVNISQLAGGALVGAANPHFDRQTTDFFAHGLDVGLEFRF